MTTKDEALKLALEALEFIPESGSMLGAKAEERRLQAITAIKEALAQPEQEPVAWWNGEYGGPVFAFERDTPGIGLGNPDATPLYTTPPSAHRQWVGLTDADIADMHATLMVKLRGCYSTKDLYKAIEAKLKEKNT